jgi:tRNA pseudouridine55 synthase
MEGVLPVLKPVHYTSHDVVAKVRRILKIKRIGHTGTLDPLVTGVLPLCIGKATRIVEYIQELPKEYEAEMTIGFATDTEDMAGTVTERADKVVLTREQIEAAILSFKGDINQIPPMYSAVKIDGKRLYELARQGQEVERKPRTVTIHDIEILALSMDGPYPQLKFRVRCSKGTYIRTLCADIGKALGYPSVMSGLVRTGSGNIHLGQCLTLADIEELHRAGQLERHMIPIDSAISHLPEASVPDQYVLRVLQGQKINAELLTFVRRVDDQPLRLYSSEKRFLGIFSLDRITESISPIKIFIDANELKSELDT